MSGFDILLLLLLAVGAVKGFRRGLVIELASLLAFVLGVIGGLALLNDAVPFMRNYIGEAFGFLPLVSFVFVFVLIGWGVHLLGGVIKTAIHLTPLGVFDNVLGGMLGGVKWLLGMSLLLYGIGLADLPLISPKLAAESQVLPLVKEATPVALQVVSLIMPFAGTLLTQLRSVF